MGKSKLLYRENDCRRVYQLTVKSSLLVRWVCIIIYKIVSHSHLDLIVDRHRVSLKQAVADGIVNGSATRKPVW